MYEWSKKAGYKKGSFTTCLSLSTDLGIDKEEGLKIIQTIRSSTESRKSATSKSGWTTGKTVSNVISGSKNAYDLLQQEQSSGSIVTFCEQLDDMLGGGVPVGKITEFCGAPGVGKTQIGYVLTRKCFTDNLPLYKQDRNFELECVPQYCFWDWHWGCTCQLFANLVVPVPEVFAKVNLAHCFFLVSKVANYRKFNFVGIFETKLFFPWELRLRPLWDLTVWTRPKIFFCIVAGLKRAENNSQSSNNSQLSLAPDKILSVNNWHDIFTKLHRYI